MRNSGDLSERRIDSDSQDSERDTLDSIEICRICREGIPNGLISPCDCTGSLGIMHMACLQTWLTTRNSNVCEICKKPYKLKITRTYRSFKEYLTDRRNKWKGHSLKVDLVSLVFFTLFIFFSLHYTSLGFRDYLMYDSLITVGITFLVVLLITCYLIWISTVFRFHLTNWITWRRNNQVITLHLLDDLEVNLPTTTEEIQNPCGIEVQSQKITSDVHTIAEANIDNSVDESSQFSFVNRCFEYNNTETVNILSATETESSYLLNV